MRFMIIRKSAENTEAGQQPNQELLTAMTGFHEQLARAGILKDGAGLKPSSVSTRVRLKRGQFSVVDGPFAETKELVAGFSIIEVPSKDDALSIMRRWPAEDGDVELELRQLYGAEDFPADPAAGPPPPPPAPPARQPGTTRYALLIKSDARTEAGALPDAQVLQAMDGLIGDAAASGAMLAGEGLKPSALGLKLRRTRGKVTIVDGPFTETKEMIAGFSHLQFRTKQEAIDFAKRWLQIHVEWSGLGEGEIEIRPFYEAEDFAPKPASSTG
jgi:hypothetical protein